MQTSRRVDDSPNVSFPAARTCTLDAGISADLMLATTLQEGGEQTLERLLTVLEERKYRKPVKAERKDVCGACLSTTRHGQPPSEPSLDRCSDIRMYIRPILLQLEPHSRNADESVSPTKGSQRSDSLPDT